MKLLDLKKDKDRIVVFIRKEDYEKDEVKNILGNNKSSELSPDEMLASDILIVLYEIVDDFIIEEFKGLYVKYKEYVNNKDSVRFIIVKENLFIEDI